MLDTKQTITRTEDTGLDTVGAQVQEQTERVRTETAVDAKTTLQNIVWYILGFIEIILALRFVFKLFGANAASSFVSFLYDVTNVLIVPFEQIFGITRTSTGTNESVFEPSVIVAVAVYALIAWGIVKLITINKEQ